MLFNSLFETHVYLFVGRDARVCRPSCAKTASVRAWGALRETSSSCSPLPSRYIFRMSYHARGSAGGRPNFREKHRCHDNTNMLRLNQHYLSVFDRGAKPQRRSERTESLAARRHNNNFKPSPREIIIIIIIIIINISITVIITNITIIINITTINITITITIIIIITRRRPWPRSQAPA